MLTQNEISTLSLSPTKKDFVQIWNELLDVAGKLSERWDPTSTNESDPGIVILKALTGIADKLNYNIDKNTLEAFMPTAAQEDSMRKLCEMLGYNIKYYQSAQTDVTVKYYNPEPSQEELDEMTRSVTIPKFTVITNSDQDVNYFTTDVVSINANEPSQQVHCMEGQVVKCETLNDNNVVTINQISENNRFYLPEAYIAENGIFVYNVFNGDILGNSTSLIDGTEWEKVDNLNTQQRGKRVYKFGFDSYESRPYLEFPDDYSSLFEDGLFIYYTRTNGAAGNISPKTLTKIELPSTGVWSNISAESFSVENSFAATSGSDIETIRQAYNNFKKTVGTFDTLVTCRDYMNKIYSYFIDGKPIVSNILVTDIRSDLNRAITICSCDDAGIFYKETALTDTVTRALKVKGSNEVVEVEDTEPAINHFDLILYPFKRYNQIRSGVKDIRKVYDASFEYTPGSEFGGIDKILVNDNLKTIAHDFKLPRATTIDKDTNKIAIGDILSINNYLRLNATITTSNKITVEEGSFIIDKVKIALANAFNMRELDFGEEIPLESIIEVIESADTRIRVASLNDPTVYTTFSVYDGLDKNGAHVTKEYAVESDWLTLDMAKTVPQLDTSSFTETDDSVVYTGTFNTKEAREIYNKLIVRNVLAGRVPLFKYNNTFNASFSEHAYQVTKIVTSDNVPSDFNLPAKFTTKGSELFVTDENPFTLFTVDGITYTAQLIKDTNTIYYTKTYTPQEYTNNVISSVENNSITEITTNCEVKAGVDGLISDVTLADGEFIKFRAPNFITKKTYPAYVNYHLALNKKLLSEATNAEATTLFDLLDADRGTWSPKTQNVGWQKLLDHFKNSSYLKTFSSTKKISKFHYAASNGTDLCEAENNTTGKHSINKNTGTCIYCNKKIFGQVNVDNKITINIDNALNEQLDDTTDAESLLLKSGCLKLKNDYVSGGFKARLVWDTSNGDVEPNSAGPDLDIILNLKSPFITETAVLNNIWDTISVRLDELVGSVDYAGNPILPTECAWQICLDFECVPFQQESLLEWDNFVRSKTAKEIFGFTPIVEKNTALWRIYGDGYQTGKYILSNTEKILNFERNYFSLLPEKPLLGIYIVSELGRDAKAAIIKNNEEYKLKANEYLYIEYTPSTTADGTSQDSASVREVLGPGTIIRPSGFEAGLVDSTVQLLECSRSKEVIFETATSVNTPIDMLSLGANEQIEIRDFAQVKLKKDSFKQSPTIYYYKNFNGCEELEKAPGAGSRKSYTLKDGEYIFYTDENKTELAYYTTGTQVTITDNLSLGTFDLIDLSTIFDSGIQTIPWKTMRFGDNDSIIFQEYQYTTLGSGDTINNALLLENAEGLNSTWQYCDSVEYSLAGTSDKLTLPVISVSDQAKGNGWEVSSILELDTSSSKAQVLRNTDKVKTSITLYSNSRGGLDKNHLVLSPENTPGKLTFKTNLPCQTSSGKITIDDIYLNPNGFEGFELKFSSNDAPCIVETLPGKTVPYTNNTSVLDIANWHGDSIIVKSESDLWHSISLDELTKDNSDSLEKALRLPISIIPNTYGVFCIYVNYTVTEQADIDRCKTWVELPPGTSRDSIGIIGISDKEFNDSWELASENSNNSDKLYLQPGINCLSIKADSKIFIKANEYAQGSLLFDELKYVSSLPIEYTFKGEKKKLYTKGLNIEQLGYLTADPIQGLLDKEMRNELIVSYLDTTYDSLIELSKDTNNNLTADINELKLVQDKLQNLITFIENIKYDIADFQKKDSDQRADIIAVYNSINNQLNKEKQLLEALNDNRDNDVIERQLLDLLESFSVENIKAQLRAEITSLKDNLLSKELIFSDKELIEEFNSTTDVSIIPDLLEHLRANVDSYYSEQLKVLADDVENVVNSDERNRLKAIFNNLHDSATVENRTKLLGLIDKLVSFTNENNMTDLSEAICSAVLSGDYVAAHTAAVQLKDYLSYEDIRQIVLEIELAAQEESDSYLADRLVALSKLLTEDTEVPDDKDAILVNIEKVTEEAEKLALGSSTSTTEILKAATNINTILQTFSKSNTAALVTEIQEHIKKLDTTYKKALDSLKTSEDAQVDYIIAKLTILTADWQAQIARINAIANKSSDSAILTAIKTDTIILFKQKAILTVMSAYLNELFKTGVNEFYKISIESVESLTPVVKSEIKFFNENVLLNKKVDTDKLLAIFDKINDAATVQLQNNARTAIIENISDTALAVPSEVEDAMSKISSDTTTDSMAVLRNLITLFTNTSTDTIAEKQQLLTAIYNELTKVVTIDQQLLNIVTNKISKTLWHAEEDHPEFYSDSFYDKLAKKDTGVIDTIIGYISKNTLANVASIINFTLTNDGKLLECLQSDMSVLSAWIKNLNTTTFKSRSLLPDLYGSIIESLKTEVTIIDNIKLAMNAEFFETGYFDDTTIGNDDGYVDQSIYASVLDRCLIFSVGVDDGNGNVGELENRIPSEVVNAWLNTNFVHDSVRKLLEDLAESFDKLEKTNEVSNSFKSAYSIFKAEEQLLKDIMTIDKNRDFYYTAPVDSTMTIMFNEGDRDLNTLMNPRTNYDINNINNGFVISKLDINYLDRGIQIAHSSRLN